VTDVKGQYTFSALRPGGYTVAVDDSRVCVTVQPRSPKVVLVSGETETVSFLVTPTSAPVVEAVLLGTSGQAVSWRSVADGPDQLDPLPVAEYTLLAFDVCSSVGLGRIQAGATLFTVGADGKPKDQITLNYLGPDPARPDWIRYQAYKPSGAAALAPGRYRVTLDDQSVLAPDGSPLDGEWTSPSATNPEGTRFHSGNGIKGGDFVFDFVIDGAAAAGLGAGPEGGDVTANADQTQFATIQGSVWFEAGADGLNPALAGQTVRLVDMAGTVKATAVTGPIDLDGDGSVEIDEQGAFRFTGLVPGTYTVEQVPTDPWRQVTDGGVVTPATLYAVTHALNTIKNTLWTIDPVTRAATIVHADFARLVARDIAMVDGATAWLTGTALAGNSLAIGASGLWRMNVATGAIVEIGGIPGGLPLFAFDALDETTLVGVNRAGTVLLYDIPTNRWETLDPLLTAGNQRLYPVGDVAVFGPGEVYAVCTNVEYTPNTVLEPTAQKLVRFDPRVRGANATVILDLRLGKLVVGLERQGVSELVGLDDDWGFYRFPVGAASVTGPAGTIVVSRSIEFGGLAAAPARVTSDPSRDDFLITIQAGETIEVGFGNRPDTILLKDGDDRIDGGCGNESDTLFGDDGTDLPWNVVTEGGNDFIRGRAGNDTIRGGQQGDVLWGEEGVDQIYGGDSEPNRIEGGADDDWLYGGGAGDTIVGGTGNDTLFGSAGDDQIFGGAGNDVLSGGADADTLVGGSGLDKSYGESGSDTLYVIDQALAGDFLLQPTAGSLYDGGADLDTLVAGANTDMNLAVAAFTAFSVNHTLASIEIGLLTGGKNANTISATTFTGPTVIRGLAGNDALGGGTAADLILGGDGDDSIAGFGGKDTLRGEAGNDTVSGGDGDDVLEGGGGNDSLDGDAGSDRLDGGIGTNTLTGSNGDDTFLVTTGGQFTVIETLGAGSDTVDLSALDGYLALRIGTLASENTITGYASAGLGLDTVQVGIGSSAVERIVLGSGDDDVFIKKGASTLARIDAGPGSDWLLYTSTAAWTWAANVVVDLGLGIATGVAAAAAGGIANFENAEGGEGNDRLFGNGADNTFYGWGGIDEIRGAAGNDSLYGMGGDDQLYGDADADRLSGGPGVNTLDGGIGSDTYVFAADGQTDTVTELAVGGTDVLDFSGITSTGLDVSVSASISVTFAGGSVTVPQADRIDVVKGSAKTDRFRIANGAAFAGVLDGFQTETPALANLDILDYTAWNTPVTVNYLGIVDDTTAGLATGTGGVKGLRHVIGGTNKDTFKGGGLPVWFQGAAGDDRLDGSSQDDLLEGDNDVDTINGFAGNDTLRGGWGNDTLAGGTGDDTYAFADLFGTDTITEAAGEGNDTMDFGLLTLPLEVRLGSVTATSGGATATYAGNAMERVVGGAGNDTFVMNSSAVTFPGTLDGGGGTNTLRYDAATPDIVAAVNAGGTPNVGSATRFASVTAVPIYTLIDVSVPLGGTLVDGTLRKGDTRLVKKGPGTLILTLANSHAYGTVVEAGEVIVRNLAALGTGVLEIRAGAKVTLDVGSVNWNGGTNFISLAGLVLDAAGRLEVGTGQVRVPAGLYDAATILARLVAGRDGGTWNGAAGITSASAGTGTSRAVGFRVMPSTGELRLGFAALGDVNLDGQVNFSDVSLINNGGKFGKGGSTGATWSQGDFNYSSGVTFTDITQMNNAGLFGKGSYLPAAPATSSLAADLPSSTGTISADLWAAYALTFESKPLTAKKR
jgi:autotransporter-associated beta strand protein